MFQTHFMKKLVFLIFLIFTVGVSAQSVSETHKKIREFVDGRDYNSAIVELQNLRQSDNKIFELNNYDYLLARLAAKQGDFANASANFQAVAARNSVLTEYALWHLSQIARSSGNLFLERLYLRELLTNAPESLIGEAANARLGRSFFESKDYDSAIASLRSVNNFGDVKSSENVSTDAVFGNLIKNDAKTREKLVWLGNAYLQSGKNDKARTVFNKLVDELPNLAQPDDFALEGVRGLDRLDAGTEKPGKTVPKLADNEHLKRANIYQFNRDFANARLHYEALIAEFPNNPNVPTAMYQIGRTLAQERNFSQSVNWFERVQSEFPDSVVSQDALNQAASAYSRVNKPRESVSRYEKLIEKHPEAVISERAYLNIIDVLRDAGETTNALNWVNKTRENFKNKTPEAVAIFAQARIHLAQKDWQKTLDTLEILLLLGNLGGTNVSGGTQKEEVLFLKGFVLEQVNRFDEAIDAYLSIRDGRTSYYGWRANERLQILSKGEKTADLVRQKFFPLRANASQSITAQNAASIKDAANSAIRLTDSEQAKKEILEILKKTYTYLPEYKKVPTFNLIEFGRKEVLTEARKPSANFHQILADELLFLGLYDEGTPELEISWQTNSANSENNAKKIKGEDRNYSLAVYYMRGDMANRTVAFIEPLWRNIPDDFQIELIPREHAEMLYPAPYKDSLLKSAPERNVDPRFVLAIMRQESRFRADVKSVAAARGLMQFISSTSAQIAFELGKDNFRQDELYHPPTAILFGSQYLSNLFKLFPDQPQAVAASYNGGEDNMQRWLKRANSNNSAQYVPEILYAQSKDYVFKVMQNYRIYRLIYDENLQLTQR
jgi:soluble lytic murein transglycosylase